MSRFTFSFILIGFASIPALLMAQAADEVSVPTSEKASPAQSTSVTPGGSNSQTDTKPAAQSNSNNSAPPPGSTEGSPPSATALDPSANEPPKPHSSKGRFSREKDAEGTQAPNRFGTDTIIKSQYELNGQSLEVDTE